MGTKLAGKALPVHNGGSVDIFLEVFKDSKQGDILVIYNEGRTDDGCIGNLTALEARAWGYQELLSGVCTGIQRNS